MNDSKKGSDRQFESSNDVLLWRQGDRTQVFQQEVLPR
jgi:hypothetical protein